VQVTFIAFHLLRLDDEDVTGRTDAVRRNLLAALGLDGPAWTTCETFDDGKALFEAMCRLGLEGVVAKNAESRYGARRARLDQDEEPELLTSRG
jgi:ATP-dependent DNA ligase